MPPRNPQETLLYRITALLMRPERRLELDPGRQPGLPSVFFMAVASALALTILVAAAVIAQQVWILLPLAPSALILLRTPMAQRASPRAILGGHTLASTVGLLSWWAGGLLDPGAQPVGLGWSLLQFGVAAVATSLLMSALRCVHEPAIATSALAAWGFPAFTWGFPTPAVTAAALLGAIVLLVLGAFVLLRLVAGWPYPLWTADGRTCRHYGPAAGLPAEQGTFWEELEGRIQRRA